MPKPLCTVLVPEGTHTTPDGREIDFDEIYKDLIQPALEAAECEVVRLSPKGLFDRLERARLEQLTLADLVLVDLTVASPNTFLALGQRRMIRPGRTLFIHAEDHSVPFDAEHLESFAYSLGQKGGPIKVPPTVAALTRMLEGLRDSEPRTTIYSLLDDLSPRIVLHEKTDVFQSRIDYAEDRKLELTHAREDRNVAAAQQIERELGPIEDVESAVLIDLLLTYRALKQWDEIIRLVAQFPQPLRDCTLVQEQLGFALNRAGRREEAETALASVLKKRGPSSETYALLGRVYKDRWQESEDPDEAQTWLDKAIESYRCGFESDSRDAYPGVNAVTLMELADPPRKERAELVPVVTYAVERKVAKGSPDYWDWATLLELAVLGNDKNLAKELLPICLSNVREPWEPETTANNLEMIRKARKRRGKNQGWLKKIIAELVDTGRTEG